MTTNSGTQPSDSGKQDEIEPLLAEKNTMVEEGWHQLEKFDVGATISPSRARLNGEWILIFQAKNGPRGVERACPHLKASLQDAVLMAGGTVLRCTLHNFTFKLADGRGVSPMGTQLRVFDIQVVDGVAYGRPAGNGACPLRAEGN